MSVSIAGNFRRYMHKIPPFETDDSWILELRGEKNPVDPLKPYALNTELERTRPGRIEEVATIFLTNRECAFHCLMCDLWKNTTDIPVPVGAIPAQIKWALTQLTPVKHLKLYNNGNFFDKQAIPAEDFAEITSLVAGFESLIVESHPRLIDERCLEFSDQIKPELQMAIGLETVNPQILSKLNKRMDIVDFERAVRFLYKHNIPTRTFILLRPPFLTEKEGVQWAMRSIDYAFETGVECIVIIPTRAGNGAMDWLQSNRYFSPPSISSLEQVLEYGIQLNKGRVFADLWDIEIFSDCSKCFDSRTKRLTDMNLNQHVLPPVNCTCG